jgi:hypothetical protein
MTLDLGTLAETVRVMYGVYVMELTTLTLIWVLGTFTAIAQGRAC